MKSLTLALCYAAICSGAALTKASTNSTRSLVDSESASGLLRSSLWLRVLHTGNDDGSECEIRGELTCGNTNLKKPIYVNMPVNHNYQGGVDDGYYLAHIDCPDGRTPKPISVSVYEEGGVFSTATTLANWWLDPIRDETIPYDGQWRSKDFLVNGYYLRARWSIYYV